MFTNLFGNYLVRKGIISEDDFFMVKMDQNRTKVKLGLIAVSEKLMTVEQADKVNQKQQIVDKRFGDIAIEMGLLSKDQVERLLSMQGNSYLMFTQCVTDKSIMTVEEVEKALEDFRVENGFTHSDIENIKSGDIDRILPMYLPGIPGGPMIDLISIIVRSLVRLVSSDISFSKGYSTSNYKTKAFALQSMTGDYQASTAFSGDDKGMLALSEGFAKEFFNEINVDALDSAGEFINIADGLFATSKSFEGMEVNLAPPVYSSEPMELNGSSIYVVPIEIEQQAVDLCICL